MSDTASSSSGAQSAPRRKLNISRPNQIQNQTREHTQPPVVILRRPPPPAAATAADGTAASAEASRARERPRRRVRRDTGRTTTEAAGTDTRERVRQRQRQTPARASRRDRAHDREPFEFGPYKGDEFIQPLESEAVGVRFPPATQMPVKLKLLSSIGINPIYEVLDDSLSMLFIYSAEPGFDEKCLEILKGCSDSWLRSFARVVPRNMPLQCKECGSFMDNSVKVKHCHFNYVHSSVAMKVKNPPKRLLTRADAESGNVHYIQLHQAVTNMEEIQGRFDKTRREEFIRILRESLNEVDPAATLHMFGSVVTGLWDDKSDMDFCIESPDEDGKVIILSRMSGETKRRMPRARCFVIKKTRIPLFHVDNYSWSISCDVSLNNMNGVYNSELIRDYTTYDVRVLQFLFIVRDWGKKSGLINSSDCMFTSYALVVLGLLFLQVGVSEPIIPIATHPELVKRASSGDGRDIEYRHLADGYDYVRFKNWSSRNTASAEELFHAFLVYYGYTFDFDKNYIDARDGRIGPKHVVPLGIPRVPFVVRDPFQRDFNVCERIHSMNAEKILFFFRAKAHELASEL